MPDRKQLQQLLVRVEGAGGEDRELDIAVWNAFFPPTVRKSDVGVKLPPGFGRDTMSRALDPRPNLTSSIDAALALVERLLPGIGMHVYWNPTDGKNHASLFIGPVQYESDALPTAPLAILAALLTALMQTQDENV